MQSRIIFLDIDGTILNQRQQVTDPVRAAIVRCREAHHRVLLCTGRAPAEIYDWLWDIGFDGRICLNGASTEFEGKVLHTATLPPVLLDEIMSFLTDHGFEFSVQRLNGINASSGFRALLEQHYRRAAASVGGTLTQATIDHLDVYRQELPWGADDVAKLTFYHADGDDALVERVKAKFGNQCTVIPGSMPGGGSGELTLRGVNKGAAAKDLVTQLGLDPADTVAIGDSENDRELIEYCGLGIAMGNAVPGIKAIANTVTGSIDEDGVATALAKLI